MYRKCDISDGWTGSIAPCPFCKSPAIMLFYDDDEDKAQCKCSSCGAAGPEANGSKYYKAKTYAVSAWNMRRF